MRSAFLTGNHQGSRGRTVFTRPLFLFLIELQSGGGNPLGINILKIGKVLNWVQKAGLTAQFSFITSLIHKLIFSGSQPHFSFHDAGRAQRLWAWAVKMVIMMTPCWDCDKIKWVTLGRGMHCVLKPIKSLLQQSLSSVGDTFQYPGGDAGNHG